MIRSGLDSGGQPWPFSQHGDTIEGYVIRGSHSSPDSMTYYHETIHTYAVVHHTCQPEPNLLPPGMPWAIFGVLSILSILGVLVLGGII